MEYHCPGWATFSGNISVEIFAKYPNNTENFGNKKKINLKMNMKMTLIYFFIIKKTLDLRTSIYHHEIEFTALKAIDIVTSKKLILY